MEERKTISVSISTQELEVKYMNGAIIYTKNDMKCALIRILNTMIDESNYKYHKEKFDRGLELLNNIDTFDCDTLATLINKYSNYNIKKIAVIPIEGE